MSCGHNCKCGGVQQQTNTDLDEMVRAGLVQKLEEKGKHFVKVTKKTTQVVSGIMYSLELELQEGKAFVKLWAKADRTFELVEYKDL
ncbi:Cystatin_domain [Hexamita inflata]|uniref:Cystatin domain n=1 Tax=Hexamita inflata TaxID=28002 RepID=A0AA86QEQ2_9EUKA|nr:Cystatin domain [Hexamita inflata]CAI9959410.1 Cystatin domain [Hexamita inflata]